MPTIPCWVDCLDRAEGTTRTEEASSKGDASFFPRKPNEIQPSTEKPVFPPVAERQRWLRRITAVFIRERREARAIAEPTQRSRRRFPATLVISQLSNHRIRNPWVPRYCSNGIFWGIWHPLQCQSHLPTVLPCLNLSRDLLHIQQKHTQVQLLIALTNHPEGHHVQ